jgi:hypothetical protein
MTDLFDPDSDRYGGGNVEDRTRFLMEVVDAAVREFGPGRVGARLAPFGTFNAMPVDPLTEETLLYVAKELGRRGAAYMHLVCELMPTGNMESAEFKTHHVDHAVLAKVRAAFPGAHHLVRRLHGSRERPGRAGHRPGGPDRLRQALYRQPGPCRAPQAGLAFARSGSLNVLHPARRAGVYGLSCLSGSDGHCR